jgi:transposase
MSPESMLWQIHSLTDDNASLHKENAKLRAENLLLNGRIDWFERQIFGQKRERYIPAESQLLLELGVEQQAKKLTETPISYTRRSGQPSATPHGRDELPAHLPRVKEYVTPDYDTTGMEQIAEKVTEELHYKNPEFYVKQIIRPVHATVDHNGLRTLVNPDLPPRCIEKGKAGASMVAQTIVTKIIDHNPLYRFQKQIKRSCGMDIPYATLNGWFAQGIFWLEPIARRLHEMALTSGYVQLDETTMRVLIQPTNGKSHRGYMHLCNAPEIKVVSFHYFNTRNQKHVGEILTGGYRGIVQTDGLDIYDFLSHREGVLHVGCHAHARRGFKEAEDSDREGAAFALDNWQSLFDIEKQARECGLPADKRLDVRRERSAPIIDAIKKWIDTTVVTLTPKDPVAGAMAYVLKRWNELTAFLHNGRIELSNNLVENRVRPHALGRKNWLFSKTEEGARRLATAYTVLATCELHGINPFDYLCNALEKLPARKANDIDDLLPMNWVPPKK